MSKRKEILGEKSYPDFTSIPDIVEVVDIFRKSEDVLPIVQDAIDIGAKVAWLQEGVVNKEAADYARKAGLEVEHFELGSFNLKEALNLWVIPYHPGSIAYFKEVGIWTAEHDKKQAELLKIEAELFKK